MSPQGAVGVIRNHEGKFLVLRRSRHVVAPGALCFPGGSVRPGESPQQALLRELYEELGVQAQVLRLLWKSRAPWGVELWWFQAQIPTGATLRLNLQEASSWYWMSLQELEQAPDLLESNRAFVAAVLSGQVVLESERSSPRG